MSWIDVNHELPIQRYPVYVKNGKNKCYAKYSRKKWRSYGRQLHKVTHWLKNPVTYPKIPQKNMRAYARRAKELHPQMQKLKMTFGPIIWEPINHQQNI